MECVSEEFWKGAFALTLSSSMSSLQFNRVISKLKIRIVDNLYLISNFKKVIKLILIVTVYLPSTNNTISFFYIKKKIYVQRLKG